MIFKTSRRPTPEGRVRSEKRLEDVKFENHKFTSRERPEKKHVIVVCCFSEFGCEVMGAMYCLPRLIQDNPDKYVIVVGWHGRAYLYKHLADEFWEINEEYQPLREHCLAFHNDSHTLELIEKNLRSYGQVYKSDYFGRMAVGNDCLSCHNFWGQIENVTTCPSCNSTDITKALFADVKYWRSQMLPIPKPSREKVELAALLVGRNAVGVTARNRKAYGRNLQPEFYVKLIHELQGMGYTPIWLGEKQSTLACPVPEIVDLTRRPEGGDLEFTLAVVSQLRFTMQFWTASTRLAGMMGVPYLIFESPDQVFGNGQESYRMALCTLGQKKLALCHYLKVYNDHEQAMELISRCIKEMNENNWEDVIGMVDEPQVVAGMREQNLHRFSGV